MTRPLVAIPTYPRLDPGRVLGWADDGVGLPARYVDALRRSGAQEALFLPELDDHAAGDVVTRVDGLLLAGGGDLDPSTYGAAPADTVYGVSAARDATELALVRAAIERGLPTLAICRGHQVLAVALGAQLDQHITGRPGLLDHGRPGVADGARTHTIRVEPDSKLAAALGTTSPAVSCHHHQAVSTVSPRLRVVATASDGVIEGIELVGDDVWIVGVQWHPEDTAPTDRAQQVLFDTFVRACARDQLGSAVP
ncbi:MAG TPA: gamma-glutamyl-gamma-aminobutyrate hydrolase family protein [Acidimicrobiia bacterium]|nr:gamma-glutamyl-gamma-aminobutyrate hydrolase family protein [Acidimicrobiia bacterium]